MPFRCSCFAPARFRAVVGGQGGPLAPLARCALRLAEIPYTWAVGWRNRRYDRGRAAIHRAGVPVVCVGNLTLGGTGKTPLVKWIAHWFRERNIRVAIVSRGYAASASGINDEALELALSLPSVPHVQDPDRVAAARRAREEHRCQLVLLDDGFQHRRLARDLDIVLLDALEPFGFDHVFPRGTLREPATGLARADVVCLSRADALSPAERRAIRDRVARLAPQAAWCEVAHAPSGLINSTGQSQPLETLNGLRVAAFCGIGNPAGFRHTLDAAGCEIVSWMEFPDHHSFDERDFATLGAAAASNPTDILVCTHKDLVKIARDQLAGRPLWAVAIDIAFLDGQDALETALERVRLSACSL